MIQHHSDWHTCSARKELVNLWPEWISQFLWCILICVIGTDPDHPKGKAKILSSSPKYVHVRYGKDSHCDYNQYIFSSGSVFHSLNSRAYYSLTSFWSYSLFEASELFSGECVRGPVALWWVRSSPEGADESSFKCWPGTLCCLFWVICTLTVPLSTHCRCINAGGNPAMD